MIMTIVVLIAVGCAFMFVTRVYSSKDAYEAINVADASTVDAMTVDDISSIPTKNIEAKLEEKEEAKRQKARVKRKRVILIITSRAIVFWVIL